MGVLVRHAERAPVALLLDMAYAAYGSKSPRARSSKQLYAAARQGPWTLPVPWPGRRVEDLHPLWPCGVAGCRWACTRDDKERAEIGNALTYASRGTWSNCNRGGQAAITRLLTEPALAEACDAERAKLHRMLQGRVQAFNAAAAERGLRFPPYEGGFFVTVFHGEPEAKAAKMREQGVFVVPQVGPEANGLRVGLCAAWPNATFRGSSMPWPELVYFARHSPFLQTSPELQRAPQARQLLASVKRSVQTWSQQWPICPSAEPGHSIPSLSPLQALG